MNDQMNNDRIKRYGKFKTLTNILRVPIWKLKIDIVFGYYSIKRMKS